MSNAVKAFLQSHTARVEPLCRAKALVWWQANTTGRSEAFQRAAELEMQLRSIYSNNADYRQVLALEHGDAHPPLLARQLVLLRLAYQGHQMSPETIAAIVRLETLIEERFNLYRAVLDGRRATENELKEILRTSTDSALCRRAWEASKKVGALVATDLLALARMRNQAARDAGFADYYDMRLRLQEIDPAWLFALLQALDRATAPVFYRYKAELDAALAQRFNVPADALRPWHYGDPFFQELPAAGDIDCDPLYTEANLVALTTRFYDGLGLEIRPILARSDLYEREGKCQHAFCIAIDAPRDVRVLCNLRPSERWMETMLHEFGHAVYDAGLDPTLPFLLRCPAHTLTTEAVAMLMGRQVRDETWLREVLGLRAERARAQAQRMSLRARRAQWIMTRWVLVMVWFERALYQDPDQDLNTRWWGLVERFQGVRRPQHRAAPDWAAKIHLALCPAYYHNYQLGELFASQLWAAMRSELGIAALARQRQAGAYLAERIFRPGARRDYNATLRHAVGKPLEIDAFVAEFVEEAGA